MLQEPISLTPSSLSTHYTHLCATSVAPNTSVPQLSQQECLDLYSKGLTAAASIRQKSVKEGTRKTRSVAARELADWLQVMPAANRRFPCQDSVVQLTSPVQAL